MTSDINPIDVADSTVAKECPITPDILHGIWYGFLLFTIAVTYFYRPPYQLTQLPDFHIFQ